MNKLICALLIISNFAFSQRVTLDTNIILIGEQINITITNKVSTTEIWPVYNGFLIKGIEILKTSEIDTTNGVISQQFIITAWDSGSYYIAPINFSEKSKTEGFLINVKTIILEEEAKLKDIKEPINEPIGWGDIWPWLIGFSILLLIIYLIKKYIFTKKEDQIIVNPKIIVPADITALQQLTKVENEKIWQKGNTKEYHSQLSEIIRRYAEDKFKFIALELTTYEILAELKSILDTDQLSSLKTLLQRADLAKFAKSKPNDSDNKESMVLAKQFVNSTKQKKENA